MANFSNYRKSSIALQRCCITQMSFTCSVALRYTLRMIRSFRHKGLAAFFTRGSKAGIQPKHASKLEEQLTVLNIARKPEEMNVPGWQWHTLSGKLAGHWAVSVNGNWRLIFTFEGEDAILVDYRDYH